MKDLEKEKVLLEAAQGNKSKFSDLYKYFLNDVYRYSYSLLNNKHEAEDVTSRVFIEFYKKLDSFEWKGISLKNWLFQTARNFSYEVYRLPKAEELNEDYHIQEEYEINFVDQIMNLELVEDVKREIEALKPIEREIISLRIWEGLGFKEIAELHNSSEDTTKKRFYRSIEKVKKSLEDKGIKRIVALPFLFTTIKQVGFSPAYAAPIEMATAAETGNLVKTLNKNTMTNITKLATSKAGMAAIAVVATLATLGGGALVYTNIINKNKGDNKESVIANNNVTPTPNPTLIPTLTPKLTSTKSPTAVTATPVESELNTYVDDKYKFSMDYPKNWSIETPTNIPCGAQAVTVKDYCKTIRFTNGQNKLLVKVQSSSEKILGDVSGNEGVGIINGEGTLIGNVTIFGQTFNKYRYGTPEQNNIFYSIQPSVSGSSNNVIGDLILAISGTGDDESDEILKSFKLNGEVDFNTYLDTDTYVSFNYPKDYVVNIVKPYSKPDLYFSKTIEIVKDASTKMTIVMDNNASGCAGGPNGPEIRIIDTLLKNTNLDLNISRNLMKNSNGTQLMRYSGYSSDEKDKGYDTGCGIWIPKNKIFDFRLEIKIESDNYDQDFSIFDEIVKSI